MFFFFSSSLAGRDRGIWDFCGRAARLSRGLRTQALSRVRGYTVMFGSIAAVVVFSADSVSGIHRFGGLIVFLRNSRWHFYRRVGMNGGIGNSRVGAMVG